MLLNNGRLPKIRIDFYSDELSLYKHIVFSFSQHHAVLVK